MSDLQRRKSTKEAKGTRGDYIGKLGDLRGSGAAGEISWSSAANSQQEG